MQTFQLNPINTRPIMAEDMYGLRAVDSVNAELMARNAERVAAMKQQMGRKYLLHPDNAPRKSAYRPVLAEKVGKDVQTA